MNTIGTVESLWRYPVKSMRGEELPQLFAGFAGVYGDRMFAFHSSASRTALPFLTAREQTRMLAFRPRFRHPEKAIAPFNLKDAESLGAGATPMYASPADLAVDVETPGGKTLAIDDPVLVEILRDGLDDAHELTLIRSDRAQTDCRPLSLIALSSIKQLGAESGLTIDKRRFRANIYLDLTSREAFAEDRFVGRSLRIGAKATFAVMQRDSRCMIITLDPETGEKSPAVLKTVAQKHEGFAGVYAVVLVEGIIRHGDAVELLD
ncbi:MAG TPA: MOSC domain-containing protein [Chthoniobacterales bacterium]